MRTFRPRFLVHGHVHLYEINMTRSSLYMGTTVVNAYNHTIIEWGEDDGESTAG